MKNKKSKFFILLDASKEEYSTYADFRKRAEELKKQGITLSYCINWKEGNEYLPTRSAFSERMRHIRAMGYGLFPMIENPEKPWHYMSKNLYDKLMKEKLKTEAI